MISINPIIFGIGFIFIGFSITLIVYSWWKNSLSYPVKSVGVISFLLGFLFIISIYFPADLLWGIRQGIFYFMPKYVNNVEFLLITIFMIIGMALLGVFLYRTFELGKIFGFFYSLIAGLVIFGALLLNYGLFISPLLVMILFLMGIVSFITSIFSLYYFDRRGNEDWELYSAYAGFSSGVIVMFSGIYFQVFVFQSTASTSATILDIEGNFLFNFLSYFLQFSIMAILPSIICIMLYIGYYKFNLKQKRRTLIIVASLAFFFILALEIVSIYMILL